MSTPNLPPSPEPSAIRPLTRRLSPVAGISLVLFLAAGLLSSAWAWWQGDIRWLPAKHDREAWLEGDITRHVSKELAKAVLPSEAASSERIASWLLVGDLGPRVRQGCDGWLFLADELLLQPEPQVAAQQRLQQVQEVRAFLTERKIELLVAVVPDKSRIAAGQLCGLTRAASFAPRASQWVAALQAQGVAALDLSDVLQPLGDKAYLKTDSHWTEAGARLAASRIARHLDEQGFQALPAQAIEVQREAPTLRPGDLVRLAGVDGLPGNLQPAQEWVGESRFIKSQEAAQDEELDLFGDTQLPNIALIGTSFSGTSHFHGFLEMALQAAVGNFAKDGGAFSGAAQDYFVSPAFKETPPTLVIWEIPERDLQAPLAGHPLPTRG